jgi:hypothetical protein
LDTPQKEQANAELQEEQDRIARFEAHKAALARYEGLSKTAKGTYTKKSRLGKPVPGGWEKGGKFTPY